MISPLWILVPIAIEIPCAVIWLSKAQSNLTGPGGDDAPVKIKYKGPIALGADMLTALAIVLYHLPVLAPALIWSRSNRISYRGIVSVMVLTAGFYCGILLLLAIG